MYGSGRRVLPKIFDAHGIRYVAIRQEVNPLFPGINPEPILPHVALLQETVVKEKCHAGLATDGDADRIGAVAEDGSFVDSHKCFAVLLNWLLVYKKWPGDVVRAFNTSGMIDRIAAKFGRKLRETFITDTGSFQYSTTRPVTYHTAGELVKLGANVETICHEVYQSFSLSRVRLLKHLYNHFHLDRTTTKSPTSGSRTAISPAPAPTAAIPRASSTTSAPSNRSSSPASLRKSNPN